MVSEHMVGDWARPLSLPLEYPLTRRMNDGYQGGANRGKRQTHTCMVYVYTISILILAIFSHKASAILCVQCDSDAGDDSCMSSPPPAENCTTCITQNTEGICLQYAEFNYCVTVRKFDINGTLLSITRTCSPIQGSSACYPGEDRNRDYLPVTLCNTVCDKDGCNSASTASTSIHCFIFTICLALHSAFCLLPDLPSLLSGWNR